MDSTSIYQDGLRLLFPLIRLVQSSVEVSYMMRMIWLNVRFFLRDPWRHARPDRLCPAGCPSPTASSAPVTVRRLSSPPATGSSATAELEHEGVAVVPDGVYTAEGWLDKYGVNRDLPLKVGVMATIDLTDSAD